LKAIIAADIPYRDISKSLGVITAETALPGELYFAGEYRQPYLARIHVG
jgi:hypothetical protein